MPEQKYSIKEIKKAIILIGSTQRSGCYDMSYDVYFLGLEHCLNTGIDVLREYDEIMWASWRGAFDEVDYSQELEHLFMNLGFWDVNTIHSEDELEKIKASIYSAKRKRELFESYKKRRRRASAYISKPEIRNIVFERDNYTCQGCNSKDNLTIDHIVPIFQEGEDSLDNLQTLCRSCNSSKGGK